ncbi:hypothetical protein RFI_09419 [Reticulomyxa filosa]|uniref:Uncharacterized protein n=1 Tax=Reticulomyxa filosa TaxID=46433 RepID=X6NPS8_RETFI|nr:hypothetical protein RFI_09419 [Reticulomyxa filosa]|eukprot:ETO27714.1 hypothetical protein RFI_09419 [Reticulomyxa filosa]
MHNKKLTEEEAYEQARFRMRDLLKQKQRIWEVYRRTKVLSDEEGRNLRLSIADQWTTHVSKQLEPTLKSQLMRKEDSMRTQPSMDSEKKLSPKQSSQSVVPYNTPEEKDGFPKTSKSEREETKFNADWEDKIKLLRFIEYTDYIAKNPHLGLKDPTELLLGVPKNVPERDEVRKRLLLQMARKDRRLKYLQKK